MFRQTWRRISPFFQPLGSLLYWSPAVVFLTTALYVPIHITGRSMQPALNPHSSPWRDIGIFDRLSVRVSHNYRKGDIVAIRSPDDPKHMLVKRIVGTEGDVIRTLPPYPDLIVHVPPGHVWVEGDEPFFSDDSNLFGPIPAALIDSKLIGILWPLPRFGRLPMMNIPRRNEAAYRHAMAGFEKDRDRSARVTFDGIVKY
ncbi:peptidase S24/S26A/S26B/S26C [Lyophyllum atratum]|nr:peptidase S24/S26A/S26B/S26C [Lyophyllum atratum]